MFKWILVLIVVAIFTVPSIAKQFDAADDRPAGNLLARYVRRHGIGRFLLMVLVVLAVALAGVSLLLR